MSTTKQVQSSPTSLTVSGIGTLASATYVVSSAYNAGTNQPVDVIVILEATTTNTPSGNKKIDVFCKASADGTDYTSGPESGTTTTAEPELIFLGSLPLPTTSVQARGAFSVAAALGYVPNYLKFIFKNDLGVALTAAAAKTAEISITTA